MCHTRSQISKMHRRLKLATLTLPGADAECVSWKCMSSRSEPCRIGHQHSAGVHTHIWTVSDMKCQTASNLLKWSFASKSLLTPTKIQCVSAEPGMLQVTVASCVTSHDMQLHSHTAGRIKGADCWYQAKAWDSVRQQQAAKLVREEVRSCRCKR